MSQVWFTSDTHFGHKMLVEKGYRPFSSVEEMNQTLIENWNSVVRPDDQVWHLGDVAMGSKDNLEIVRQLNGRKHLIAGNHDAVWPGHRQAHRVQREWMDLYGWESIQPFARRRINGRTVFLCHFPHAGDHTDTVRYPEYRLKDTGEWLLHGHVHDSWLMVYRQINVGVDVWNWTPVPITTITDMIEEAS